MADKGPGGSVWFEDFLKASAPWYDEFARANAAAPPPAPTKPAPAPRPGGGANRRAHERFRVEEAGLWLQVGALARLLNLSKGAVEGRVANLSEGGVMILTSVTLEAGAKCRARIVFEKFRDVIESRGEVRWSRQVPGKEGGFAAGIQFLRLDAPLARKIALMREYFGSVQYREIRELRRREEEKGLKFPP